ncbi:MAG TPA: hypothetical protein VM734_01825 [Kofleriaceae bacterium]|nr:hypothetical protein [Kofleriaceae bacterium]
MGKSPEQRRKDRARPFSRKHARYWLTAAGGMVLIMVTNLVLGFWLDDDRPNIPPPQYAPIPPMLVPDAGVPAEASDGGAAEAPLAPAAAPAPTAP